jgi:hypothetical protein
VYNCTFINWVTINEASAVQEKQVFDSRSVARAVGAGKVLLLCVGGVVLFVFNLTVVIIR